MNETQEYLEIMAGRKRLELEYKTGDIVSGYTAYGLHARIIESLHCGQNIAGWGFLVDREFEDGDIDKMKRHYFEWKELQEFQEQLYDTEQNNARIEREEMLKDVVWKQKEKYQFDGSIFWHHEIEIQGQTYLFTEKKIQGMGRVILPEYEIDGNGFEDAVAEEADGRLYWAFVKDGKEEKVEMSFTEKHAYQIVFKYGKLTK